MGHAAARRISELERINAELIARCQNQETTIRVLKSERQALLMRLFARRSEKMDPAQVELFRTELVAEAAAELEAELKAKSETDDEQDQRPVAPPRRNGRRRPPAELRRERRQYTLAEHERLCPCCHIPMQPFGEDVTEQLEYVPASTPVCPSARAHS